MTGYPLVQTRENMILHEKTQWERKYSKEV